MDNRIQKILQDLYAIEPSLKLKEKELQRVVEQLLLAKPDTKFDSAFAAQLKRRLMAELSLKPQPTNTLQFMKKLNFIFGGIAAVALLVAGTVYYVKPGTDTKVVSNSQNETLLASEVKFNKVAANAFGTLNVADAGGRGGAGGNVTPNAAPPQGQGTANVARDAVATSIVPVPISEKMIAPAFSYKYVYKGEPLPQIEDQMDVLRRMKGEAASKNVVSILGGLNFGLANLSSFKDSTLQSFQIAEDREFGYTINVNLLESSISIMENWQKWPQLGLNCVDQACYDSFRMKISDIPSDQKVIDIANAFLKEHGIPQNSYGQPFVQNQWRTEYDRATDKSQVYIPDMVSVVYPLMLDGKAVLDESGNETGLTVSVNVRYNRVSGMYDITSPKFDSSSYKTESDTAKILKLAEQGGFRNYYYQDPSSRSVEVELGTPHVSYVKLWNFKTGSSEELLVPAYIFPITKMPSEGPTYQKNVVVPVVKEILDNQQPPFYIMDAVR